MARGLRTGDGARLRAQKFNELLRRGWFVTLLVVLPAAALVFFAARQNAPVALGAPLGILAVLLFGGWAWADKAARRQVVQGFAAARGLTFHDKIDPPPLTPLLHAGDEREMSCAMTGSTAGMHVLVAHYTYTDISYSTDSDGHRQRDEDHHHFTVATTPVEEVLTLLPTLHLRPRRFLQLGSGWLNTGGLDKCETESVRFNERYRAWHREGQDPLLLRRFLDPSTVDALANHPLDLGVELSAGQLLVYIDGHCGDSGELAGLLEALGFLRRALFAAARIPAAPASQAPPAA